MKIVTVEQIQAIEKSADAGGYSYQRMMENAGRGVATWVMKNVNTQIGVIGLVGSGNNGGDTLIALSSLAQAGIRTLGFLVKSRADDSMMEAYLDLGGSLIDISQGERLEVFKAALIPGVVILDGILGTGIRLPVRGKLHEVMGKICDCIKNRPDARIIAVDCPSGVDCNTGEVSDVTFPVDVTLCMAAIKQGLLMQPARSFVGDLHLIDIGLKEISQYIPDPLPEMIDHDYVRRHLPQRSSAGHKGTFGTCLVIAGTAAYTGAAFLTGKAAYRAGCGLVNIATLRQVQQSLSGHLIEAVWTILPDLNGGYDPEGANGLSESLTGADALILGPGWGIRDQNKKFLENLLVKIPKDLPTVIDADALKLLSRLDHWWESLPQQAILTPHPGEMAILTGLPVSEIQSNRWAIAQQFAKKWGLNLILKGAVSVVAIKDSPVFVNPVSDSSLATAGSGDVLCGVIGGLLAQGITPAQAAILGTWLHGQAGIFARKSAGTDRSVTAMDILNEVGKAFVKSKEAV
jgi:NAD(P)H-hydrate epimerase